MYRLTPPPPDRLRRGHLPEKGILRNLLLFKSAAGLHQGTGLINWHTNLSTARIERLGMSWKFLEDQSPGLAEFGVERLNGRVAYLATIRKDGSPRLHPMTPIIGEGHLFVFMEPTSPKGHDLQRDGRYAIHCSVGDTSGESGEFIITGQARLIDDPEVRALAVRLSSYSPADRYILFEFDLTSAASTIYLAGQPVRKHWEWGG